VAINLDKAVAGDYNDDVIASSFSGWHLGTCDVILTMIISLTVIATAAALKRTTVCESLVGATEG